MMTYTELLQLKTFEERFEYLKLRGFVGRETFGFERYLNQTFYHTKQWRDLRSYIIVRDLGCDLAIPGREIPDGVRMIIHHMNPISLEDMRDRNQIVLEPEFLILTTFQTHNLLHYGSSSPKPPQFVTRIPNDTCPWKR